VRRRTLLVLSAAAACTRGWQPSAVETTTTEIAPAAAAAAAPTRARVVIESGPWQLHADLVVPGALEPVPAVILLNKAAGERGVYKELAEHLLRQGIASLRLDLRGHGESINQGIFVPDRGTAILDGSADDVAAAYRMLRADPRIDGSRIGLVGASYSGEVMMEAGRTVGFGAAYVGLSPGSLSDESIAAIDRAHLPWLLVVSRHERHLTEVVAALRETSRTGELLELSGTAHATNLLAAHPDLAERLALWLRQRLVRLPPSSPAISR
jgi:dienelactone hydrolase